MGPELTEHTNKQNYLVRVVQWYTVLAVLPSRLWAASTHAPAETGESWF
ncbi:hypothetical protein K3495_g1816 [Podosphaera aphanis]|nr:hypothetical protein K3495_g1816 [Podosphaera aphanis]